MEDEKFNDKLDEPDPYFQHINGCKGGPRVACFQVCKGSLSEGIPFVILINMV
jgi:hypothetical protein